MPILTDKLSIHISSINDYMKKMNITHGRKTDITNSAIVGSIQLAKHLANAISNDKKNLNINQDKLKLVNIAAFIMHSIDNQDNLVIAQTCFLYLVNEVGASVHDAKFAAEAIANKSYQKGMEYFELNLDVDLKTKVENIDWTSAWATIPNCTKDKDVSQKLLHDSEYLLSVHDERELRWNKLDSITIEHINLLSLLFRDPTQWNRINIIGSGNKGLSYYLFRVARSFESTKPTSQESYFVLFFQNLFDLFLKLINSKKLNSSERLSQDIALAWEAEYSRYIEDTEVKCNFDAFLKFYNLQDSFELLDEELRGNILARVYQYDINRRENYIDGLKQIIKKFDGNFIATADFNSTVTNIIEFLGHVQNRETEGSGDKLSIQIESTLEYLSQSDISMKWSSMLKIWFEENFRNQSKVDLIVNYISKYPQYYNLIECQVDLMISTLITEDIPTGKMIIDLYSKNDESDILLLLKISRKMGCTRQISKIKDQLYRNNQIIPKYVGKDNRYNLNLVPFLSFLDIEDIGPIRGKIYSTFEKILSDLNYSKPFFLSSVNVLEYLSDGIKDVELLTNLQKIIISHIELQLKEFATNPLSICKYGCGISGSTMIYAAKALRTVRSLDISYSGENLYLGLLKNIDVLIKASPGFIGYWDDPTKWEINTIGYKDIITFVSYLENELSPSQVITYKRNIFSTIMKKVLLDIFGGAGSSIYVDEDQRRLKVLYEVENVINKIGGIQTILELDICPGKVLENLYYFYKMCDKRELKDLSEQRKFEYYITELNKKVEAKNKDINIPYSYWYTYGTSTTMKSLSSKQDILSEQDARSLIIREQRTKIARSWGKYISEYHLMVDPTHIPPKLNMKILEIVILDTIKLSMKTNKIKEYRKHIEKAINLLQLLFTQKEDGIISIKNIISGNDEEIKILVIDLLNKLDSEGVNFARLIPILIEEFNNATRVRTYKYNDICEGIASLLKRMCKREIDPSLKMEALMVLDKIISNNDIETADSALRALTSLITNSNSKIRVLALKMLLDKVVQYEKNVDMVNHIFEYISMMLNDKTISKSVIKVKKEIIELLDKMMQYKGISSNIKQIVSDILNKYRIDKKLASGGLEKKESSGSSSMQRTIP